MHSLVSPSSNPQLLPARRTMRPGFFLLMGVALACSASLVMRGGGGAAAAAAAPGTPVAQHCLGDFDKVTSCLDFVQGKGAAPSKQCCGSVGEIRESDPACLCFFIEQIHNGSSPMIKSMNIQEGRLLQLPSACNLKNASVSDCPKLLGIPPSSPDAAIFTNASSSSTAAPTTAGTGTGTPSLPEKASDSSSRNMHGSMSASAIVLATILFTSFPGWLEL
ncbi:hypothetical protein ACJRO7_012697 [Eucalyptus globulus]|uniref:Bifunctional inhibitor/plant lipid transfer protein/seed storage helical domain-containing protein n=1 Tax=Eucalyptus globulus TaxID=34317 RepID=A0ABD3LJD3_EUCGL